MGTVAGAGGPGWGTVARTGARGGAGIDGTLAAGQPDRVLVAGYAGDFYQGGKQADVQPGFGWEFAATWCATLDGTEQRQRGDGNVAGAAVASVRDQAEN